MYGKRRHVTKAEPPPGTPVVELSEVHVRALALVKVLLPHVLDTLRSEADFIATLPSSSVASTAAATAKLNALAVALQDVAVAAEPPAAEGGLLALRDALAGLASAPLPAPLPDLLADAGAGANALVDVAMGLSKLDIGEITPSRLRRVPESELLMVHLRVHQWYANEFAGNDRIRSAGGMNREDVVNAEIFLQNEMARRGLQHHVEDGLTREADALRQRKAEDYAPIYPSGDDAGRVLSLPEVLSHFRSFKLRMPFLYLVGGLANHGESKNDIDILMRGPVTEEMRRVIEFRLGRMLPPELSQRLQLHADDFGGPFTNHVELADLVVEFRPQYDVKQMRDVSKQDDPLLDWPKKAGPHPAVLQIHFRGASAHGDLRFQVDDFLVGWTLAFQRPGAVPKVETVEEAKRIASTWTVNGSRYFKPMIAPAKVYATPKSRQPTDWLKIEAQAFEPGSVGATRFEEGVIVAVDRPFVEWGLQKPYSHEYFLTRGEKLSGILFYRMLVGGKADENATPEGETFWTAFLSKEYLPSVLGDRAVETQSMPPDGYSGLPSTLEAQVPPEYRYWKEKGKAAREMRDALVAAKLFTKDNVVLVDGQFRRVEKKVYLAAVPEDGQPLRKADASIVVSGQVHLVKAGPGLSDALAAVPAEACACVTIERPDDVPRTVEALRKHGGDWLVNAPNDPQSLWTLAGLARPFRLRHPSWKGRVMAASFAPGCAVEWADVADEPDVEKQPRTVPFTLSWQYWKGPTVVRAAPSRQVWRMLLADPGGGGLWGWELRADPLSGEERIAGLRRDFKDDALLSFEGDVPPAGGKVGGEVLNDTKNTPSHVRVLDSGTVEILDDQQTFKKLRFHGKELKGVYTLVAEGGGQPLWIFSPGELPGRPIPAEKAERVIDLTLADGTVLKGVQVWNPEDIKPGDDRTHDRERLRPLALLRPMKVAPRPTNEFRTEAEVEQFATPEALRGGIYVEPKYNGFRYLAEKDASGQLLLIGEESFSRKTPIQNSAKVLPALGKELASLPGPYILDCEFMAFDGDQPVARRDLAAYRATQGVVDDSKVRLQCFRLLYHPKQGNLLAQDEEKNRPVLEAFLSGKALKHVAVTPRKVAHTPQELHAAIRWAAQVPGSEGAMLKLAVATYSLGGENDAWAKLRLVRTVNAIIYDRLPVKDSPGVWNFLCAVGPIPASDRDKWAEVVEVKGKLYTPIGKTFNSSEKLDVGDAVAVDVVELLDDQSGSKRRVHWFIPVVVGPAEAPMTVEDVGRLLADGELKKLEDAIWERHLPLIKTAEEHYVLGVVLEPETVDSQRDIYSAEEVRRTAHRFMERYRNIGLMHRVNVNDKVTILESYIAPTDFDLNGQHVKAGTWLLAVRVNDPEMWAAVKSGALTGFSIGGSAVRRPEGS